MYRHHDEEQPVSEPNIVLEKLKSSQREGRSDCSQVVGPQPGAPHRAKSWGILLASLNLFTSLPVDEMKTWNNEQDKKPEPEKNIDFVIDHVNWEDTQTIKPWKFWLKSQI